MLKDMLKERDNTHGNYYHMADVSQELKFVMSGGPNWNGLLDTQREALEYIATKIARILCGDPFHKDHWKDIAGYATLVDQDITEFEQESAVDGIVVDEVPQPKGTGKRRKKSVK